MCKPTRVEITKNSGSKGGLSQTVLYISAGLVLLVVIFPMIVSEIVGGWTTKFTSPVYFTAQSIPDLTHRVAIVTGANTGIGYHTALELARKNAHVIIAARSPSKGETAASQIQSKTGNKNVEFLPLDLASLTSVRSFVEKFKSMKLPLDILVLNAGIMKSPGAQFVGQNMTYGFELTQDGFEAHIGINHVGHFYLTQLLRETLIESAPSRVIAVSSIAEEGAYQPEGFRFELWKPAGIDHAMALGYEDGLAYGQSKLANALFAKELAEQLREQQVTAYSCHPGIIISDLTRYLASDMEERAKKGPWWNRVLMLVFGKYFELAQMQTSDGALTQLHLAVANTTDLVNGGFYHPVGRLKGNPRHMQGSNETLQKQLWRETERMIREAGF